LSKCAQVAGKAGIIGKRVRILCGPAAVKGERSRKSHCLTPVFRVVLTHAKMQVSNGKAGMTMNLKPEDLLAAY
jgi:hypothetical protein